MNTCPTILELFARLENIGDISGTLDAHVEQCDDCADLSASLVTWYEIAPVQSESLPLSEQEALNILSDHAGNLNERTRALLQNIFLTSEGRSFVFEAAVASFDTAPVPESLEAKLSAAAAKYAAPGLAKTILSYILELTDRAGASIKTAGASLQDALMSVVHVPVLTPAMQAVRSPVYDDVAIIEKKNKVELPFYFDK